MDLRFDIYPAATPTSGLLVSLTDQHYLAGTQLRVELHGLGLGTLVVNRNQSFVTAANFAPGNYVEVFDRDISTLVPLFGFFFDERFYKVLSVDEGGGQIQRHGGHGVLSYLGRVVLDKAPYAGPEGPRVDGNWWWYQDQYGDVLKRLIDEAQDPDRPGYATLIPAVTYDFTGTNDSGGVPWDTFAGSYSLPVTMNYLDVVQKLIEAGLFIKMDPNFLLQAYQSGGYGSDRTSATFADGKIRFVSAAIAGANANIIGDLSRTSRPGLGATRALVKGDSADPATMVTRTAAGPITREITVDVPGTHVASILEDAGDRALGFRTDATDIPIFRHRPGGDYLAGLYSPFPIPVAGLPSPTWIASGAWDGDGSNPHNTAYPGSGLAGDLLVIHVAIKNQTTPQSTSASAPGFSAMPFDDNSVSSMNAHYLYRWADGTETGTVAVTGVGTAGGIFAQMHRFRGVGGSPGTPSLEGADAIKTTSATVAPNPVITTGPGRLAVCLTTVHDDNDSTHTLTGGTGGTWTERTENSTPDADDIRMLSQTAPMASAGTFSGATGTMAVSKVYICRTFAFYAGLSPATATYWVGDLVRIATGTGVGDYNEVNQRVYAISLVYDEDGEWWPVPELGPLIFDRPALAASFGGIGGGGAGGGTGTAPAAAPPATVKQTMTNKSGGELVHGDVVVLDPANDRAVVTTTVEADTRAAMVVQETIAADASGLVATHGYVELVNVTASVTRGQYGTTSPTAKKAVAAATRVPGAFCQFETGGTIPAAILFGAPDPLVAIAALAWKTPVRAATTADGTLASAFENGDTVDGVVLATGDRILLKNQSAGADNGIYVVKASGAPTRAVDFDAASEALGAAVLVTEGTANADKIFLCTANAPITLGTTALPFAELGGVGDHGLLTGLGDDDHGAVYALLAHSHAAGDSSKASASGDLTPTTTTAQDVPGATLSLGANTYIVVGVFDVTRNGATNDRTFEGVLDVGGTDENDLAAWTPLGSVTIRDQVAQIWRVVLGGTTTVKLQGRHAGGSAGDFTVNGANTTLTAHVAGGGGGGGAGPLAMIYVATIAR